MTLHTYAREILLPGDLDARAVDAWALAQHGGNLRTLTGVYVRCCSVVARGRAPDGRRRCVMVYLGVQ